MMSSSLPQRAGRMGNALWSIFLIRREESSEAAWQCLFTRHTCKSICSERLFCTLAVDDLAQVRKQPLTLLTNQHPSLRLSCGEGKCFTWELAWGLATRFFHLNIPTGCCHPPYSPEGEQEQAYILKGGFSHLLVIFVHIWDIFFNWNHSY